MKFRIATWNVGDFNDGHSELGMPDDEYEERLPIWRKMLGHLKADILCMQEYCPKLDRSLQHDSVGELFGDIYPYNVLSNNVSDVSDGLATMSQRANNYSKYVVFTEPVSGISRRLVHTTFLLSGKTINVINTVLMNDDSAQSYLDEHGITGITPQEIRAWGMDYVINYASGFTNVIFLADWNTGANGASEMTPFTDAGYKLCNGGYFGEKSTVPLRPGYAIDNIVVSPNILINWSDTFDEVATELSDKDHIPYYADLSVV